DDAAVRGHAMRDALEELRHSPAGDLRVCTGDERCRIDEIDEQNGCELSFHGPKSMNDRAFVKSPENPAFKRKNAAQSLPVSIQAVLDPKVFKAYDVRGIYPTELDEEGAYAIGRAFVEQFEPRRIAVGHDMRVSS